MTPVPKLFAITAEGLNRDADDVFEGKVYLSRRPSSASFWFANLAIDADAAHWTGRARDLLSEPLCSCSTCSASKRSTAAARSTRPDERPRWCTCMDTDAPVLIHGDIEHRGHVYEPCYACWFGAHDRCWRHCVSDGEIHFPETVMTKAAAA